MCKKIETVTEAVCVLVQMDDKQREALRFDESHRNAADLLRRAVSALRPPADLSALNALERSVMAYARDTIHAVLASVDDRRSSEVATTSRRLTRGMRVTVLPDLGQPEDCELGATGKMGTVVAVTGELALVTLTMVEDGAIHRYYLVTDEEFFTPSYYDRAEPGDIKVIIHCSPDALLWALDVDKSWLKKMTESGRKAFREAKRDCEKAMSDSEVSR